VTDPKQPKRTPKVDTAVTSPRTDGKDGQRDRDPAEESASRVSFALNDQNPSPPLFEPEWHAQTPKDSLMWLALFWIGIGAVSLACVLALVRALERVLP